MVQLFGWFLRALRLYGQSSSSLCTEAFRSTRDHISHNMCPYYCNMALPFFVTKHPPQPPYIHKKYAIILPQHPYIVKWLNNLLVYSTISNQSSPQCTTAQTMQTLEPRYKQYMGNQRKHIIWTTYFRSPSATLAHYNACGLHYLKDDNFE